MTDLLISWCVTSSILLAVFLLLRGTLFRRLSPRVRYALWTVVLLRLLAPFQIPGLSLPASAANLAPELPVLSNRPLSPDTAMGFGVIPSDRLEDNGLTIADDGTVQTSRSDQDTALWELQENGEVYMYFGGSTLDDVLRTAVVLVWGAGAGVVLLAVLAANLRFAQKLRQNRRPLPTAGCPLPVYEAEGLPSPCLCGVLRPAVYLTPEAAADGQVRTHVLAHELTHYCHQDHIWSLLRCLALALHWYNPLVWAAAVLSKRDGELSCDEGTIRRLGEGERIPYGRTLIGLVARRSGAGGVLSCSTTMTGGKKTVQRRIAQLVKQPETKKTALFLAAATLALAVVFVFAGQSDQQATWRRFQNAATSAAAICYGPPTFSSQFWPADITDADLLEEARSLLLDAQPASRSPDADWNQAVLHASSLILMPELNEAYDYFLVPFQGDTYILTPAQWDAETYTPVAVLEDQNVISALEDLTRTQYERNQEQTESESGFSPEGLVFSSSGADLDTVAQDFGAALVQAYRELPVGDPGAVVFAQADTWEITQRISGDDSRFCLRLSLIVQPLAPNTVYWMAGAGLDLTEDGRWRHTMEYRLEKREDGAWQCAEAASGGLNLD